jgi:hypothetical protein
MGAQNVQNVINYLNGSDYNRATLPSDINIVCSWAHNKINFEGFDEFDRLFRQMINKRTYECIKFFNNHYTNYPSYLLEWCELYRDYPFRQSRDPLMDRDIFFKTIGFDNSKLDCVSELYSIITGLLSTAGIQIPDDFQDKAYNTICNFGLPGGPFTIDNLRYAKYVSRMSNTPFPETLDDAREVYTLDPNKENTGFFGEHLAVDYIKKFLGPDDEIIWASKDIGDGFGFDILIYNHVTNKVTVFEIKAANSEEEFNKDELTFHENICKERSLDKSNGYEFRELRLLLNRGFCDYVPSSDISKMDLCYYEGQDWKRVNLITNKVSYSLKK